MATAEEILAMMEDEPEAQGNEVLVIDNDLRTITVPPGIILGVESDDSVRRLNFRMPKTYGEFDLSIFGIRINYMNANNQGDVYAVEDAAVNGDTITFSWLVGRNATLYKGSTKFIVCLKKTDASGIVQKEYNTTLASLPVLEGLETTEAVVQANPDIIEQMLKRIEGLTQISPDDVSAAVAEYMAANPINVPTKLSDLQDDAEHRTVTDTEKEAWDGKSDFSGDYRDLQNQPTIPDPVLKNTQMTIPVGMDQTTKRLYAQKNKLLKFEGAATGTYDGTEALTIKIPESGTDSVDTERIGERIASGEFQKIILLGDSITHGTGGSGYGGNTNNLDGYCWANVFKKFVSETYGATVSVMGYYGSVAELQVQRVLNVLTGNELVIWLTGTNNRETQELYTSYETNISDYISQIRQNSSELLVVGCIPASKADEDQYYKTTRDMNDILLSMAYGIVPYVPMYSIYRNVLKIKGLTLENTLTSDGLHPNDVGHQLIFEAVCRGIGLVLDANVDYSYGGTWWGGEAQESKQVSVYPYNVGSATISMSDGSNYLIDYEIPAGTIKEITIKSRKEGSYNLLFAVKNGGNAEIIKAVPVNMTTGINYFSEDIVLDSPCYFVVSEYGMFYDILSDLTDHPKLPNGTLTQGSSYVMTTGAAAQIGFGIQIMVQDPVSEDPVESGNVKRIEKTSTDTAVELQPNTLYVFPEMAELSLTFAAPTDTAIVNEYHVIFQSGATPTMLTIPETVKVPDSLTMEANKVYELSVMEDCLSYQSWEVTTT